MVFVITVDEKEKKSKGKMRKICDLQIVNHSSKLLLLQHYLLPTYYLLLPVQAVAKRIYKTNLEEKAKG